MLTTDVTKDKDGLPVDLDDIFSTISWLMVLASPRAYRTMKRVVDTGWLVHLIDVWIAYADRGYHYWDDPGFSPVPYDQRGPLGRRIRELIAAWSPPELPAEIMGTARALLHAEGVSVPEGWDACTFGADVEGAIPVEDRLAWPEGIPLYVRHGAAGSAGEPRPRRLRPDEDVRAAGPDQGHVELTYLEPWNDASIVGCRVVPSSTGQLPRGADLGDVSGFILWLMVFAAPPLFRTLRRVPTREHLIRLVDTFISFTARGEHVRNIMLANHDVLRLSERAPLARQLRALLEVWTPPELPQAITDTARALLGVQDIRPPEGGWDQLKHPLPCPLEDILLWPEGIPVVLHGS